MPTADYIEGGYTKLEWNLFRFLGSLSGLLMVLTRARGAWAFAVAVGSSLRERNPPDTAHASCPSTHTRWFVGMFEIASALLPAPLTGGGVAARSRARFLFIHSFTYMITCAASA